MDTLAEVKSVKFLYNGMKINNGKLVKLEYKLLDNGIYMEQTEGGREDIPGMLFGEMRGRFDDITNETMESSVLVPKSHPLYDYVYDAYRRLKLKQKKQWLNQARKWAIQDPTRECWVKNTENEIAKLESEAKKGQPSAMEIRATILQMRAMVKKQQEEEEAREKAELEAEIRKWEEAVEQGRQYVESVLQKYPKEEGEPEVKILWSEDAAFASFTKNDQTFSMGLRAAETIICHLDLKKNAERLGENGGGYNKTKIRILMKNEKGEVCTYELRYDLGDNDGGLIKHIRTVGNYYLHHNKYGYDMTTEETKKNAQNFLEWADLLEAKLKEFGYTEMN